MKPFALTARNKKCLWFVLLFTLVARLATSALMPLFDHTESRYGEMARKMLETGDWVAPLYNYGVPFWGKPPLSFWLSALCMKVLGVNAFAARLPALLLEIGILGLVYALAKRMRGSDFALLATMVLATMAQFFVVAGTVMTDSTLAFCCALSLVSFWLALMDHAENRPSRLWGWLFFAGLGLGLLAKGPLIGVLVFLPLVPWILWRRAWGKVWHALPWIGGTVLMLAIAVPWYVIAERKTPGFLEYFLVGEHFYRFTKPGWTGDKYGHAHQVPHGMIWVYWFTAALPWTLAALYMLLRNFKSLGVLWRKDADPSTGDGNGFRTYLLVWALAATVFFTAAGNIIWPYCMPVLPAVALLVTEIWLRFENARPRFWQYVAVAVPIPALMLLAGIVTCAEPAWFTDKSERKAVAFYLANRPSPDSRYFTWDGRVYSAEFYTGGQAIILKPDGFDRTQLARETGGVRIETLSTLFADPREDYISIYANDWEAMGPDMRARFTVARAFRKPDLKECGLRLLNGRSPFDANWHLPRRAVAYVVKKAK